MTHGDAGTGVCLPRGIKLCAILPNMDRRVPLGLRFDVVWMESVSEGTAWGSDEGPESGDAGMATVPPLSL